MCVRLLHLIMVRVLGWLVLLGLYRFRTRRWSCDLLFAPMS
jgi:hypothetical protein